MKYNFDEIINRENTDCLKWDCREQFFGRNDIIPLWVADMDFKTPDFIIDALRQRLEHEIMAYAYRPDSFFKAAQGWLKRRNGWNTDINHMTFTPGIVSALDIAVSACTNAGDKIVVQPPVYNPFFTAVQNHGRELVYNPLTEKDGYYTIDFDDLENKLANGAKMLILCNPHNPVGRVWTKDELLQIGNLCVKHNVIIISDEIHSDLIFKPYKHVHIASLSEEIGKQTLTFFAPSKTFNIAGLSTAIAHSVNPDILGAFKAKLESYHVQMGNIFGNVALEAAYNKGDEWLEQLLDYIEGNIDWVKNYIETNIPQIKVQKAESTYLMWLDCRALNLSQPNLVDFMVNKAHLALNDGAIFGKEGEGFMRLNAACPRATLKAAMEQLKQAINA